MMSGYGIRNLYRKCKLGTAFILDLLTVLSDPHVNKNNEQAPILHSPSVVRCDI